MVNSGSRGHAWLIAGLTLAITVAAAVWLRLGGRPWWCGSGSWVPWALDIHSPYNSQRIFDPYTFSHILHGVIFYGGLWFLRNKIGLGWRWVIAIGLEAVWEVIENSPFVIERYRSATTSFNYTGDSVINALADIAWCGLGFWIAHRVGLGWSLALFCLFEIGCLVWVRDNLTLNVVMLFYPIASIKAWQAG